MSGTLGITRPRRVLWVLAGVLGLCVLDGVAWGLGIHALRVGAAGWAAARRAGGVAVDLGAGIAGGWPVAARLRFAAASLGGSARVDATAELSPFHPFDLAIDIDSLRLEAPTLQVAMRARRWTARLPFQGGALAMTADALHWQTGAPNRPADTSNPGGEVMRLTLRCDPTLNGVEVALQADDARLDGVPAADHGDLRLDALVRPGWPEPAIDASASAQAWREAGGAIQGSLSLVSGGLDLAVRGQLHLDRTLSPEGAGVLEARGLPAAIDLAAAAGAVPMHAGTALRGVLGLLPGGPDGRVTLPVGLTARVLSVAGFPLARMTPPPWVQAPHDKSALPP